MEWYVVHTKPRQEERARLNLERQGFGCFLPTFAKKKITKKSLEVVREPLFSRYLFIELDTKLSGKSWAPIRSTLGVSKLVSFGTEPARIDSRLIDWLRAQETALSQTPQSPYQPGDLVEIKEGPFKGVQAIYQIDDGESRAMVLIELLQKPTKLQVPLNQLAAAR
ncbi:MAG: transcription/translation regulatory transformer protein RfaH [Orrella sp.]